MLRPDFDIWLEFLLSPEASKIQENAMKHKDKGLDISHEFWFLGLAEEVGELASALMGDHEHPPEYELAQIAGICWNWLRKLRIERDAAPAE